MADDNQTSNGQLALQIGKRLPLKVLASRAGFYIGTEDEGLPCSRESTEYWPTEGKAVAAFLTGVWTQRLDVNTDLNLTHLRARAPK